VPRGAPAGHSTLTAAAYTCTSVNAAGSNGLERQNGLEQQEDVMKALTRITALTGAALLLALGGPARAADDEELTVDQVKAKVEAAGFVNVSDIHREGDHFEATAATKKGEKVELEIDARTGSITAEYE
jgi:hypothetical protein